jgi:tetratricopeptide (TPR) repeat protein
MKKLLWIAICASAMNLQAQTKKELTQHFESYYKAMRQQSDVQGIINALTHLNILSPDNLRRDTLAYVYASNNQHIQALNTLGIEENETDSDLAIQVKASSLKAIGQLPRALAQYNLLSKRKPSPYLVYEMADLNIQLGKDNMALLLIEQGIAQATEDMKYAFYERQEPYEVSLKAAFLYLKGLATFNKNKEEVAQAIALLDEAIALSPNFNLAQLSKQALAQRKTEEN